MTVAIVGCGIAGLAAAIVLARSGRRVTLFEQAAELGEIGAGLQLAPNALKALDWLGVLPALEPALLHPHRIEIRSGGSGAHLAMLPLADMPLRHGAGYALVHRADLLAALVETVRAHPEIEIATGARVEAVEHFDRPLLRLEDGTVEAEALIGADGLRSAVRRSLAGEEAPRDHGGTIWRALVPAGKIGAPVDAVCLWLLPGGHVVHYPLRKGALLNIVAVSTHGSDAPQMQGSLHPALAQVLAAPSSWVRWRAEDRDPAREWGRGAVTLVGDAAHPTLPYLAQGAAMALEDAVALARAVEAGSTYEASFRAYEAARKGRTTRLVLAARRQGWVDHLAPPLSLARDLAIKAAPPGLLQRRLDWIHGWRP